MTTSARIYSRVRRAAALAALLATCTGCGRETGPPPGRAVLAGLVERSVGLYTTLHPLRGSRLGLPGADSLLFTFSSAEIEAALSETDSILSRITALPASHFETGELDDSATLIGWLRGESYALRKVRLYRTNPMLYCWMVEEALSGIPSRTAGPEEGEFYAYERRLSKIPALLSNASGLLDNPAEIFIGPSYESVTTILSGLDQVRSLSESRYGRVPASLEEARRSIESFAEFLLLDLSTRARGRFILGTETLSDILRFSEGLDIDLEETAGEAEKSVRKYLSQVNSIHKNASVHAPVIDRSALTSMETMIDSIESLARSRRPFGEGDGFRSPVYRRQVPPLQRLLPANPYLVIPSRSPGNIVSYSSSMFSAGDCRSWISIAPGEERMDPVSSWYDLLAVSSPVTRIGRMICSDGNIIPSLLLSELFMLSWEDLNRVEMMSLDAGMEMSLRKIHLQRKIRDLTLMIVVFRLHSGMYDLDSATAFLTRTLGLPGYEARLQVVSASISPSIAMPGLAALLGDRLVQRASTVRNERRPKERVYRFMTEYRGRPPGLILDRIDR
ncbi:MAG TPA: hypothetical protein VLA34_04795 [Candidatus Krumholzibacterium sp.]|nr:hypothetical protein [Candidatus Krumholzibacterium sp.]